VINPTKHSQETNIHAPGGNRTHNPNKRAAMTHALGCVAIGISKLDYIGTHKMSENRWPDIARS